MADLAATPPPADLDWSAATFDGARGALRRDVARATAQQRMEWLDAALRLAQHSGALARRRLERQVQAEQRWAARRGEPAPPLSVSPGG